MTAKMSRRCSEYRRREKYAQNILDVVPYRPCSSKRLTKPTAQFISAEIFHYHHKIMK